jgi:hypothetical protein
MKTTIITILILLAAGILTAVYTSPKSNTTEVDLLVDVTDRQIAQPDVNEIIPLYNFDDIYNGGVFSLTKLTDVSYNPTIEAKISSANQWLTNELDRDKEIKNFKAQVTAIITNACKDTSGRVNSSLYLPIATELNNLSTNNSQRRILLIYSDLIENTVNMSFYKRGELELLKTNPEKISKYFDSLVKLNSLSGIEVFFIYQPDNNISDQVYQIVSNFYRKLLEDKGAKVTISASINL